MNQASLKWRVVAVWEALTAFHLSGEPIYMYSVLDALQSHIESGGATDALRREINASTGIFRGNPGHSPPQAKILDSHSSSPDSLVDVPAGAMRNARAGSSQWAWSKVNIMATALEARGMDRKAVCHALACISFERNSIIMMNSGVDASWMDAADQLFYSLDKHGVGLLGPDECFVFACTCMLLPSSRRPKIAHQAESHGSIATQCLLDDSAAPPNDYTLGQAGGDVGPGPSTAAQNLTSSLNHKSPPWTWGWLLAWHWATQAGADTQAVAGTESRPGTSVLPRDRHGWSSALAASAMGRLAAVSPVAFKAAMLRARVGTEDLLLMRAWVAAVRDAASQRDERPSDGRAAKLHSSHRWCRQPYHQAVRSSCSTRLPAFGDWCQQQGRAAVQAELDVLRRPARARLASAKEGSGKAQTLLAPVSTESVAGNMASCWAEEVCDARRMQHSASGSGQAAAVVASIPTDGSQDKESAPDEPAEADATSTASSQPADSPAPKPATLLARALPCAFDLLAQYDRLSMQSLQCMHQAATSGHAGAIAMATAGAVHSPRAFTVTQRLLALGKLVMATCLCTESNAGDGEWRMATEPGGPPTRGHASGAPPRKNRRGASPGHSRDAGRTRSAGSSRRPTPDRSLRPKTPMPDAGVLLMNPDAAGRLQDAGSTPLRIDQASTELKGAHAENRRLTTPGGHLRPLPATPPPAGVLRSRDIGLSRQVQPSLLQPGGLTSNNASMDKPRPADRLPLPLLKPDDRRADSDRRPPNPPSPARQEMAQRRSLDATEEEEPDGLTGLSFLASPPRISDVLRRAQQIVAGEQQGQTSGDVQTVSNGMKATPRQDAGVSGVKPAAISTGKAPSSGFQAISVSASAPDTASREDGSAQISGKTEDASSDDKAIDSELADAVDSLASSGHGLADSARHAAAAASLAIAQLDAAMSGRLYAGDTSATNPLASPLRSAPVPSGQKTRPATSALEATPTVLSPPPGQPEGPLSDDAPEGLTAGNARRDASESDSLPEDSIESDVLRARTAMLAAQQALLESQRAAGLLSDSNGGVKQSSPAPAMPAVSNGPSLDSSLHSLGTDMVQFGESAAELPVEHDGPQQQERGEENVDRMAAKRAMQAARELAQSRSRTSISGDRRGGAATASKSDDEDDTDIPSDSDDDDDVIELVDSDDEQQLAESVATSRPSEAEQKSAISDEGAKSQHLAPTLHEPPPRRAVASEPSTQRQRDVECQPSNDQKSMKARRVSSIKPQYDANAAENLAQPPIQADFTSPASKRAWKAVQDMAASHQQDSIAVSQMLHRLAHGPAYKAAGAGSDSHYGSSHSSASPSASISSHARAMPYLAAFQDDGTGGGIGARAEDARKGDILLQLREAREKREAHQAELLDAVATALEASMTPPQKRRATEGSSDSQSFEAVANGRKPGTSAAPIERVSVSAKFSVGNRTGRALSGSDLQQPARSGHAQDRVRGTSSESRYLLNSTAGAVAAAAGVKVPKRVLELDSDDESLTSPAKRMSYRDASLPISPAIPEEVEEDESDLQRRARPADQTIEVGRMYKSNRHPTGTKQSQADQPRARNASMAAPSQLRVQLTLSRQREGDRSSGNLQSGATGGNITSPYPLKGHSKAMVLRGEPAPLPSQDSGKQAMATKAPDPRALPLPHLHEPGSGTAVSAVSSGFDAGTQTDMPLDKIMYANPSRREYQEDETDGGLAGRTEPRGVAVGSSNDVLDVGARPRRLSWNTAALSDASIGLTPLGPGSPDRAGPSRHAGGHAASRADGSTQTERAARRGSNRSITSGQAGGHSMQHRGAHAGNGGQADTRVSHAVQRRHAAEDEIDAWGLPSPPAGKGAGRQDRLRRPQPREGAPKGRGLGGAEARPHRARSRAAARGRTRPAGARAPLHGSARHEGGDVGRTVGGAAHGRPRRQVQIDPRAARVAELRKREAARDRAVARARSRARKRREAERREILIQGQGKRRTTNSQAGRHAARVDSAQAGPQHARQSRQVDSHEAVSGRRQPTVLYRQDYAVGGERGRPTARGSSWGQVGARDRTVVSLRPGIVLHTSWDPALGNQ